jgi:hypothetical protein
MRQERRGYQRVAACAIKLLHTQLPVLALLQDLDEEQAAERERKERAEAAKSEFEKLQADRRSLPIYPYREQLLQANPHNLCCVHDPHKHAADVGECTTLLVLRYVIMMRLCVSYCRRLLSTRSSSLWARPGQGRQRRRAACCLAFIGVNLG